MLVSLLVYLAVTVLQISIERFRLFIFMRTKFIKIFAVTAIAGAISSCASTKLATTAVAYQSVRTEQYKEEVPNDAHILVAYGISADGELMVTIKNLTDEVMIIDQTKTFFVNTDGMSVSYYDPTVITTSVTDMSSSTTGASVNLGAIGGALGIGGTLGGLLGGINVGGSETGGTSFTTTTMKADLPQYSLGPKGMGTLSKHFSVTGIGRSSLSYARIQSVVYTRSNADKKFSVCVTYSVDGGKTFDKIVTPLYLNAQVVCPVGKHGKVNDALRNVLTQKPDALNESWWLLYSVNNVSLENDHIMRGALIDFK